MEDQVVLRIKTKFPHLNGSIPPTSDEREQLLRWLDDLRQNGITMVDAHVRLFLQEFIDHCTPQDQNYLFQRFASHKLDLFAKVAAEKKHNARKLFNKSTEQAELVEKNSLKRSLFIYISTLDDPDALVHLLVIIARCKTADPLAFEELHLNTLPNIHYYARLFAAPTKKMVDKIRTVLEPKHILKWFKEHVLQHEFDHLIKRIEKYYDPEDHKKREIETASCLFARGLVHCTDGPDSTRDLGDWYYHFLNALLSHGDCRMFPRNIDPNYQDDLVRWEARKISAKNPLNAPFMNDVIIEQEAESEVDGQKRMPRDQRDYKNERKTDAIIDYEPESFDLRPYQNELVLHAKSGRNTIICAPTGSGKTFIAVEVIKDHLEKMHREGRVGRCVMLVPTVPLVDQQCLQFVTFLGCRRDQYRPDLPYWIDAFSGCENSSEGRANRVLGTDICVMTPQILINMMNSVLRKEKLYFSDFTLLIFDECHHCVKGHPYKILVEMLDKELPKMAYPPQIVGLTASMGVGDSGWDMNACRNHMLDLCSNLMADSISTVRHQLDDLRNYVVPPVDHVVRVSRPKYNPFIEEIDRVMLKIEADMAGELKGLIPVLKITEEDIKFPPHDSPARYQTMVGQLKKIVNRVDRAEQDKRFLLVRSIDHLSHYFHTIVTSDLLPNKYGLEYLEEKMKNYMNKPDSDPIEQINNKLLQYYSEIHPRLKKWSETENVGSKEILKKLYEELNNQFQKEPHSRCMIFVATRNCAQKLADHLNQTEELPMFYQKNNVGFMVSSNQSGAMGGQSSQEQQRMRQDFNSGKIKVLVVTSVAEEGLDIAACNLIIK